MITIDYGYSHFDEWIRDMEIQEYSEKIYDLPSEGGFTKRQTEHALQVREPLSPEELAELEKEQEEIRQRKRENIERAIQQQEAARFRREHKQKLKEAKKKK